jgi:ribosomal protein S18 acetylase RimI-like enzyme
MRLDTLLSMKGARRLYERYGFEEIEAYYDTPLKGTSFLGKKL